jgi:hypothetical protein
VSPRLKYRHRVGGNASSVIHKCIYIIDDFDPPCKSGWAHQKEYIMLLKDFIALLQNKYDAATADPEYYEMMGEPAIFVDTFNEAGGYRYVYAGYSPEIRVDMDPSSGDYVISAFGDSLE